MTAILISAIMGLTAIAELIFYAFKDRSTSFILGPAFSNVGRIDHFIDLQVVTLNGASCSRPLETIYEKGCYFNQTNIPRLFISLARFIGVGKEDTLWVGVAIGAVAISAVLLAYALCLRQWRLVMATACGLLLYPFRLALLRLELSPLQRFCWLTLSASDSGDLSWQLHVASCSIPSA